MAAAGDDIISAWKRGLVPDIVPSAPESTKVWPRVSPGHGRLQGLLMMWIKDLPNHQKCALMQYLSFGLLCAYFFGIYSLFHCFEPSFNLSF